MKKGKRILSAVLAMAMILPAGCGSKQGDTQTTQGSQSSAAMQEGTTSSAQGSTEAKPTVVRMVNGAEPDSLDP